MLDHIFPDQERLKAVCEHYKIIKLAILDAEFYPTDMIPGYDIMMLVEFGPEVKVGYFKLFSAAEELSQLLDNQKIDLRMELGLRAFHRSEMLESAVIEYAA